MHAPRPAEFIRVATVKDVDSPVVPSVVVIS